MYDAQGKTVGDAFTLAFDKDGKTTYSLKAGQKLNISGLTDGWEYSVSEAALDGYTQTFPVDDAGAAIAATGALTAGGVSQAAFANAYSAASATYDTAKMGLKKVLTGRDWLDSDSFAFTIKATDGGPLPVDAAGITYSDNKATLTVTVEDDLSGNLSVTSAVDGSTFTNTYAEEPDVDPDVNPDNDTPDDGTDDGSDYVTSDNGKSKSSKSESDNADKDAIAKTGDNSLALGVGIGIIALAAGAVVLVARNRRHA